MNKDTTINEHELAKFAKHANTWWDLEGPLKTLHDINATRLEFILKETPLSEKKVLDVGCGGGILTEALAKAGAHVLGIDAEKDAIEIAQNHAKETGLEIQYQCTPVEELKHDTFDVITCMEMLEHVNNPELVIMHCARLLNPGGMLFLSTINRTLVAYAQAIVAAEYILGLLPRQTHDFDKFITPSELAAMLRKVDLEVVELVGMKYNPITRKSALTKDVGVNYLMRASA